MRMRDIIALVEGYEEDRAAFYKRRAEIDAEGERAKVAYHDAREAGDGRVARIALDAFNAAQKALRLWDEQEPQNPATAAPVPSEDDYRGQHSAPTRESGAPLWDVTGSNGSGLETYPADFYRGRAYEYCADEAERPVLSTVMAYHNRPNAPIKIYRSIPTGLPRKINVGDWVTTSRRYAVEHGRASLRNDFVVVSKTVAARDIFTAGDSLLEWGYDPQPRVVRRKPEGNTP